MALHNVSRTIHHRSYFQRPFKHIPTVTVKRVICYKDYIFLHIISTSYFYKYLSSKILIMLLDL